MPPKHRPMFNAAAFGRRFRSVLTKRGLSLRAAQQEIGIDQATLCRVSNGRPPNVENYLRLVKWMEADDAA